MSDLKVNALVQVNDDKAPVFNRSLEFIYEKENGLMWASDGIFYSCYGFEPMSKSWKAFGGIEFDLPLKNGEVEKCFGQWWDAGSGLVSKKLGIELIRMPYGTLQGLKKCYVFTSAYVDKKGYEELIKNYNGCIYPYWDYERVIKFDDMRSDAFYRQLKLEKAKNSLVKEVKKKHKIIQHLKKGY